MFQNGYGVRQDYAEAMKWYRKSAEQGNVAGQNNIGWMFQNGYGVRQDYAEAMKWYRKSAEQGNESAKANLESLQAKPLPPIQKGSLWARQSSSSSVTLSDISWRVANNVGSIRYGKIANQSAWDTGSLKLCLWLSANEYNGGTLNGTQIGECILSAEPLPQGYEFSNSEVTFSPISNPATGDYKSIVTVNEYHESGNWYIVGWVNFGTSHWTH